MITLYDLFGLLGISLSICCYARVQWRRDYSNTLSYSLFNLISALLLAVSLLKNWNLASFISNSIWGLISAYGLWRWVKYTWQPGHLKTELAFQAEPVTPAPFSRTIRQADPTPSRSPVFD
jgi:hypothetical protein